MSGRKAMLCPGTFRPTRSPPWTRPEPGDCFHGAYAFALTEGRSPLSCALYATAAAAISVTGQGGRMALPDHDACIAKMAEDAPGAPEAPQRADAFERGRLASG